MSNNLQKCVLGCGRVGDEIGQCGSFATCSGHGTDVVPGRDVLITVPETGEVRCVDPIDALMGRVKISPIQVNEHSVVTARVIPPALGGGEAPAFTPAQTTASPVIPGQHTETATERKARLKAEAKATPAKSAGETNGDPQA